MDRITIADVEQRIYDIEKFEVRILNTDGTNARGDREVEANYFFYLHMARHKYSCEEWRNKRFSRFTKDCGVDFLVDVLHRDGRRAHGNTKLSTVRDTYLPED